MRSRESTLVYFRFQKETSVSSASAFSFSIVMMQCCESGISPSLSLRSFKNVFLVC